MTTSLRAKKGVLTRQSNTLDQQLDLFANLIREGDTEESTDVLTQINRADLKIRTTYASTEKAFYAFTAAVDSLGTPLEEDEERKVSEYIDRAQELMCRAEAFLTELQIKKLELTSCQREFHTSSVARFELPRLPIPEFSGRSWQWDNFWELFNATVHSQPIPDLQKFNYLLQSLKGEARESIARYQVTSTNYVLAINHLKDKYGRTSEIVTELHRRLEKWSAKSTSLKDQRRLFDQLSAVIEQLRSKGQDLDNPWLTSKILSKFSENIQRYVLKVKVCAEDNTWTLRRQMECLDNIIKQEEQIEEELPRRVEAPEKYKRPEKPAESKDIRASPSCFYCDSKTHWPVACTKITNAKQRLEHLRAAKRCINCGSQRHVYSECKSTGCRICGKKHHTSLCFKAAEGKAPPAKTKVPTRKKEGQTRQNVAICEESRSSDGEMDNPQEEENTETNAALTVRQSDEGGNKASDVFLLSGVFRTEHPRTKNPVYINVLFDTGADRSFIDACLARELELPKGDTTSMKLSTFGASQPREIECTQTELKIWDAKGKQHSLQLYTHDILTASHKQGVLEAEDLAFIKKRRINLCCGSTVASGPPQIVLGCDQLWSFVDFEAPQFTLPSGLLLIPTRVGYIVSGKRITDDTFLQKEHLTVCMAHTENIIDHGSTTRIDEDLDEEEFTGPEKVEKAKINTKVLENFNNSIERRQQGYFVRLPFKNIHETLPDNRVLARRRLESILNIYKTRPDVLQQYHEVFQDQLRKNIIEEVDESKDSFANRIHYLPHQPVITPEKDTTKFRVVFDASAHYKNRPSLNDMVHQGPTILPKVYEILLRFRVAKYVLLSDVEKAFLQVYLHEEDRDVTRCLWVRDIKKPLSEDNLVVYRFTRVTFGINASPFLLSGTILFHLNNHVTNRALAEEIATNLYVDNLFVGANSKEEAIIKYKDLKLLFEDINMNLRAFLSNDSEVMEAIKEVDRSSKLTTKVLGIPWNSINDTFELQVKMKETKVICKRSVAQQIASIFDPLGWFAPLLVRAKAFQQRLWKDHYDWDEPLNATHTAEWNSIVEALCGFTLSIPRQVVQQQTTYCLITYSDASRTATAASTYLVSDNSSYILMAKSKIVDSKGSTTTPKLEIHAITMGARLTRNVLQCLKGSTRIHSILLLSDSEISLKWLNTSPRRLNTGQYVSNRVKEVHQIVREMENQQIDVQLGYIDTGWNPADCATRGVTSPEFTNHIWWKGYSLREIRSGNFVSNLFAIPEEQGEDEPSTSTVMLVGSTASQETQCAELMRTSNHNSYSKVRRVLAYALRFLRCIYSRLNEDLKTKLRRNSPWMAVLKDSQHLAAEEIRDAEIVLIQNHQRTHLNDQYRNEITAKLNLKMDKDQIWRASGRMNNSELPESSKNPIIIVPKTELSRLIIAESHSGYHKSIGHTMSDVRQRFWIPKLREQVKRHVRACIPCQKLNNLPYKYPEMTDLPARRVIRARPFQHIGLDYFGPITVKEDEGTESMAYGCIFTCAVTRLIHLETVPNGTTQGFLNAFRRFVARRGIPQTVTCDNAPIFVLGSQILNGSDTAQGLKEDVARELSDNLIEWHHITPYSPWKGGFYERLIRSIKDALFKTVGRKVLSMELLGTFLAEIEGCLNARPLTYQEADFDHTLIPLRPIDFIQKDMDIVLQTSTECNNDDDLYLPPTERTRLQTHIETLKALQSSQALTEKYWTAWRDFYLTALREHHRRHIDQKHGCTKAPRVGEVVLLTDPCQKRYQWKMARISKLVLSNDGAVREVEVTSGKRVLRRPVNQLVPLEIEGNDIDVIPVDETRETAPTINSRYNLRPRHKVTQEVQKQLDRGTVSCMTSNIPCRTKNSRIWPITFYLKMALALSTITASQQASTTKENPWDASFEYQVECRRNGVYLHAPESTEYELCVNDQCIRERHPPIQKLHKMPSEEILLNFEARWKIRFGHRIVTVEKSCPAQQFCLTIDCTICLTNILNPECWPLAAIIGLGIFLYLVIALCYTIFYVPVTVGRPVQLLLRALFGIGYLALYIAGAIAGSILRLFNRRRYRNARSILEALAILYLCSSSHACQIVNIFSHHMKSCTTSSGRTTCVVDVASVVKMNTFKRDACFRLQNNETTVLEIRLQWEKLHLLCDKSSNGYTRNVEQRVIDSKRCAHMGSCKGNKCADVNATSLLPELSLGNSYPGVTGCLESCGGIGCDCLSLSSGCLFYRIYAVPTSNDIYELFSCARWKEQVKMRVQLRRPTTKEMTSYIVALQPNIPIELPGISLTLSVLALPPLPGLENDFITTGNMTALWSAGRRPTVECSSKAHAENLRCTMHNTCLCSPAQSQVVCRCEDYDLSKEFRSIEKILPITLPSLRLTRHPTHSVLADVENGVSAELILNTKEIVTDSVVDVINERCTVTDTQIFGCYGCKRGALAEIVCMSSAEPVTAEIECDSDTFTVHCSPSGEVSKLRFMRSRAQVQMRCSVKCGLQPTSFKITGVLKYVHSLHRGLRSTLQQQHNDTSYFEWPDLSHIMEAYLEWYKSVLIMLAIIAGALILSYFYLTTACTRFLGMCVKGTAGALYSIIKITACMIFRIFLTIVCVCREKHNSKSYEKML